MTSMIRNLTPHPAALYRADAPDQISDADEPDRVFPVDGPPARLRMVEQHRHPQEHLYPIEVTMVEYGHVEGLPPRRAAGDRVVYYLVSLPVALALPDRDDLLVPYREVRNAGGTVVGCRGLARPVVGASKRVEVGGSVLTPPYEAWTLVEVSEGYATVRDQSDGRLCSAPLFDVHHWACARGIGRPCDCVQLVIDVQRPA